MGSNFFRNDYNDVTVGGGFQALPAGGYICRIVSAKATKSKSGLPMVEAAIDIIDGDYTQYFSKRYNESMKKDPANAKWPYNGVLRVVAVDAEGHTKPTFKGFCTSIENSCDIVLPKDNDDAFIKALKGKELGVIFGREEYMGNDGKTHWTTKPRWYRDSETITSGDYQTPEDQPYDGNSIGGTGFTPMASADSFAALEEELPF